MRPGRQGVRNRLSRLPGVGTAQEKIQDRPSKEKGDLACMKATTLDTALIAHAPDAIIFADCAGVIRLWNQGAEALFGYSAAEAVGQTLDLIVPAPSRTAHWAGFSRAVHQGRFTKDDVLLTSRALTKDGSIAVELSAAII